MTNACITLFCQNDFAFREDNVVLGSYVYKVISIKILLRTLKLIVSPKGFYIISCSKYNTHATFRRYAPVHIETVISSH